MTTEKWRDGVPMFAGGQVSTLPSPLTPLVGILLLPHRWTSCCDPTRFSTVVSLMAAIGLEVVGLRLLKEKVFAG